MTSRSEQDRDAPKICVRCYVAGRVQGVFFRASTRQRAQELSLTGYARNLADGRVEVLACGSAAAVAQLQEWLRRGPPGAQVTGVACEPVSSEEPTGFVAG